MPDSHCFLAMGDSTARRRNDIHLANVVFRRCKTSRIGHSPSTLTDAIGGVLMLTDNQEPIKRKSGGVHSINHTVKYVEPSKTKDMYRRLFSEVRSEVSCENESEERVDVHGELQRRELEAGEDSEEAIEARDFVE